MATKAKEVPSEPKKAENGAQEAKDDTEKAEESVDPVVEDPNEAVALALKFRMMSGNPLEVNCSGCKEWEDVKQRVATHLGVVPYRVLMLANREQYRPMHELKDIDPSIEITVIQEPMSEHKPPDVSEAPQLRAMSPADRAMMRTPESVPSVYSPHGLWELELQRRRRKKAQECVDWERLAERRNSFINWVTPGWYKRYQERQFQKDICRRRQEIAERQSNLSNLNGDSSGSLNRLYGLAGDAQHSVGAALALGYLTDGKQGIPAEPVPNSGAVGSHQGNRA